jgi:hypothetical protein
MAMRNIKNSQEVNRLEIYHYGILGMKWGVRRNSGAYKQRAGYKRQTAIFQETNETIGKNKNPVYKGLNSDLEDNGRRYVSKGLNAYGELMISELWTKALVKDLSIEAGKAFVVAAFAAAAGTALSKLK